MLTFLELADVVHLVSAVAYGAGVVRIQFDVPLRIDSMALVKP